MFFRYGASRNYPRNQAWSYEGIPKLCLVFFRKIKNSQTNLVLEHGNQEKISFFHQLSDVCTAILLILASLIM